MLLFNKLIDRRLAVYQRELIEIHYAEVENMYRQIRGWRHDYRSHIQLMKVLAAQGDLDGIRGYLDELDGSGRRGYGGQDGKPHGGRHPQQQDLPGPVQAYPRPGRRQHPGGFVGVRAGFVCHPGQPVRQRH